MKFGHETKKIIKIWPPLQFFQRGIFSDGRKNKRRKCEEVVQRKPEAAVSSEAEQEAVEWDSATGLREVLGAGCQQGAVWEEASQRFTDLQGGGRVLTDTQRNATKRNAMQHRRRFGRERQKKRATAAEHRSSSFTSIKPRPRRRRRRGSFGWRDYGI